MDSNERGMKIITPQREHPDSPIIYRPKPKKKLCISSCMLKSSQNGRKNGNKKHYPLTPVSNTNINCQSNIKDNYENKNKSKLQLNKKSKFDFDKISLEEIENDFTKLKARSKAYEEEKEILYLLRNSTKDNSMDEDFKETKKIKRPKNPFLENFS